MNKILVTGANGQLGQCLKDAATNHSNFKFVFASREQLDIEDIASVEEFFLRNDFDYCINTAAYTNVEKAESEPEQAYSVNAEGVKNLSEVCKKNRTVLIQISTDYVFDGKKRTPYVEDDATKPLNVYGASKLKGEDYVQAICDAYFIFRTSWLYSQYGHNFLNTMLKYGKEGKKLTITTEQTGTPTNANDLAGAILKVIETRSTDYGVYHFSNAGKATWYDFAREIFNNKSEFDASKLAQTDHYATFAVRPSNSVLNTEKVQGAIGIKVLDWKTSLKGLLNDLIN